MAPRELFGVGVRLIGLAGALAGLPQLSLLPLNLGAALQVVAGVLLLMRADLLVNLCYPPKRESWRNDSPHPRDD